MTHNVKGWFDILVQNVSLKMTIYGEESNADMIKVG
jgi:hypothetical protein